MNDPILDDEGRRFRRSVAMAQSHWRQHHKDFEEQLLRFIKAGEDFLEVWDGYDCCDFDADEAYGLPTVPLSRPILLPGLEPAFYKADMQNFLFELDNLWRKLRGKRPR